MRMYHEVENRILNTAENYFISSVAQAGKMERFLIKPVRFRRSL